MLKGKTALVTGSTSGIGQGIAEALAAEGANIVLNGFGDAAAIETLRAQIAADNGVTVTYDGADMSKPAEIARMVKDAEGQFGAIDILVNNAGIQYVAPIEEFPDERWWRRRRRPRTSRRPSRSAASRSSSARRRPTRSPARRCPSTAAGWPSSAGRPSWHGALRRRLSALCGGGRALVRGSAPRAQCRWWQAVVLIRAKAG